MICSLGVFAARSSEALKELCDRRLVRRLDNVPF